MLYKRYRVESAIEIHNDNNVFTIKNAKYLIGTDINNKEISRIDISSWTRASIMSYIRERNNIINEQLIMELSNALEMKGDK